MIYILGVLVVLVGLSTSLLLRIAVLARQDAMRAAKQGLQRQNLDSSRAELADVLVKHFAKGQAGHPDASATGEQPWVPSPALVEVVRRALDDVEPWALRIDTHPERQAALPLVALFERPPTDVPSQGSGQANRERAGTTTTRS